MELIDILCRKIALPRSEIKRQIYMGLARVDREVESDPYIKIEQGQLVQLGKTFSFIRSDK